MRSQSVSMAEARKNDIGEIVTMILSWSCPELLARAKGSKLVPGSLQSRGLSDYRPAPNSAHPM